MLRVYYGWSEGGPWLAPDSSRLAFAGRPYLYKIQVASQHAPGDAPEADDPCLQFLKAFLPVLKDHLVPHATD